MKVAIIGAIEFDSLEYHIHDELTVQGKEAKIFDYKNVFPKKIDYGISQLFMTYVEKKNKKLLDDILYYKPDLVIGIYRHIHPLLIKGIKEKKIKIINLNPDQLATLQHQQMFVETYDAYFTKDAYMLKFMKNKLNLNAFQYQEAFNPRVHLKPNKTFKEMEHKTEIDVLCFGNLYAYRNRMLRILKESGINITLFGHKAKYFDPFLSENFQNRGIYGGEKANILNGAKIVFNNLHYAEIESVNNKFFEITGSGAFQICDYKPILKKLLPLDPKLISFETINEAERLIKHYLKKPEARWEIRNKLYTFFQQNYTYENLIKNIFSRI